MVYSFVSGFFCPVLVCWINHIIECTCPSFSLLYGISLCEYITIYLPTLLMMGIQVVFSIANSTTVSALVLVFQ